MLRPLGSVVLLMASLFCASAIADNVAVSVDFGTQTGQTTQSGNFSMNIFQAFEPKYAENAKYRANVAAMGPPILRFHNESQMDSSKITYGWVISPTDPQTCNWDYTKIDAALTPGFSYPTTKIINISNWPKCYADSTGKLDWSTYGTAYTAFCVGLVQNLYDEFGITEFELLNEADDPKLYGDSDQDMQALADIFVQVSAAMRAAEPQGVIKVGGPAFLQWYAPDLIDSFFTEVQADGGQIDFVTFHAYPFFHNQNTYSTPLIYDSAYGEALQPFMAVQQSYTNSGLTGSPPFYLDEYNINGSKPDQRMIDLQGAVFDALVTINAVDDGLPSTMLWNEASNEFGALSNSNTPRPSAFLYQALNRIMVGTVYTSTPAGNAPEIVPLAVESSTSYAIELVNRAGVPSNVVLSVSGISGLTGSTEFTVQQVRCDALSELGPVTYTALQAGYSVPTDSITFLTLPRQQ